MILDRFLVTDQVAVVTASGRGIGAATAVALAEAGADVVLAARTEDQLREVAKQVEATGRRAIVVPGRPHRLRPHGLPGRDGLHRAGPARHRRQQHGRHHAAAAARHVAALLGGGLPLQRVGRARPGPGRPCPDARGRPPRRGHRQHLVGHGTRGRPRLRGLRHRQGRPRAVHPAGLARPGAAHPRQRHRRRLDRHLGAGHRHVERRAAHGHGGGHPAQAPRATSTTSRRPSSTWSHPPASYVTGKIIEVDGGLQSPNLEMPIPDL